MSTSCFVLCGPPTAKADQIYLKFKAEMSEGSGA